MTRILDRAGYLRLKEAANRQFVMPNDLLLGAMFHVMREWNRRQEGRDRRAWLRIGMPASMRTPRHDRMPAANAVSYTFVTCRPEDCDRPESLRRAIHAHTSAIVHGQTGQYLLKWLRYSLLVPGLVRGLLRSRFVWCTMILANVGDVRRQFTARFPLSHGKCVAGNVVLESFEGAAPVRPQTSAVVSLGTYAGKLYMNLHCDPLAFSQDEAESLADLFLARVLRECESAESGTVVVSHAGSELAGPHDRSAFVRGRASAPQSGEKSSCR